MSGEAVESRTPMAMACATLVPFGKFEGKTIARVGSSDVGLAYLRWASSIPVTGKGRKDFAEALKVYLAEPSITKRLDDLGPNFDARTKRS